MQIDRVIKENAAPKQYPESGVDNQAQLTGRCLMRGQLHQ